MCIIACAQHHAVALHATHVAGLQVRNHDDLAVLHLLQRHEADQACSSRARGTAQPLVSHGMLHGALWMSTGLHGLQRGHCPPETMVRGPSASPHSISSTYRLHSSVRSQGIKTQVPLFTWLHGCGRHEDTMRVQRHACTSYRMARTCPPLDASRTL